MQVGWSTSVYTGSQWLLKSSGFHECRWSRFLMSPGSQHEDEVQKYGIGIGALVIM